MRSLLRVAAILAAVLGLVFGITTTASAGTDGPKVCNSDSRTACVKFYNDGDVIRVWDEDCDGHGAVAHVWSPEAGIYNNLWNTDGCGTYADYAYGSSMPEGDAVYYQACSSISYAAGTYEHCSSTIGGGRS